MIQQKDACVYKSTCLQSETPKNVKQLPKNDLTVIEHSQFHSKSLQINTFEYQTKQAQMSLLL